MAVRTGPLAALATVILEVGFVALLWLGASWFRSDALSGVTFLLFPVVALNLYRPFQELLELSSYRNQQTQIAAALGSVGRVDLRQLAPQVRRDMITTVYQEVHLFPDTVRANLTVGRPGESVDPGTARRIQEALGRLAAGRTVLVVANRLNTIETADQIVVMDRGVVEAHGSHAELMASSGVCRGPQGVPV